MTLCYQWQPGDVVRCRGQAQIQPESAESGTATVAGQDFQLLLLTSRVSVSNITSDMIVIRKFYIKMHAG